MKAEKKRVMEVDFSQYAFERAKYACEKLKKSFGTEVQKILARKVAPTLKRETT